jgi:hypothetical protein
MFVRKKTSFPIQNSKFLFSDLRFVRQKGGARPESEVEGAVSHEKAKRAVSLHKQQMFKGCGLKQRTYGLAPEGKARWCAGFGKAERAVDVRCKKCEVCGLKWSVRMVNNRQ